MSVRDSNSLRNRRRARVDHNGWQHGLTLGVVLAVTGSLAGLGIVAAQKKGAERYGVAPVSPAPRESVRRDAVPVKATPAPAKPQSGKKPRFSRKEWNELNNLLRSVSAEEEAKLRQAKQQKR